MFLMYQKSRQNFSPVIQVEFVVKYKKVNGTFFKTNWKSLRENCQVGNGGLRYIKLLKILQINEISNTII